LNRSWLLILLILGSVVAAGCASVPEEAIAARIRAANSPIVRDVDYRPPNMLDPAEIDVWLRPDARQLQATSLWCDVIVPVGGQRRVVAIYYSTGTTFVSLDPSCGPRRADGDHNRGWLHLA
jgi:hypothetical protein